jgi:hypothetical protein
MLFGHVWNTILGAGVYMQRFLNAERAAGKVNILIMKLQQNVLLVMLHITAYNSTADFFNLLIICVRSTRCPYWLLLK